MHIFICTFAVNHKAFCVYFFLHLSTTLFVSHLVPTHEIHEEIYLCPTACTSSFVHLCASFSLTFHLIWEIWLHWYIYSQNKPCIFYNHILVNYWKWFGIILLVLWCVSNDKICVFIIMVLCHLWLISAGTGVPIISERASK